MYTKQNGRDNSSLFHTIRSNKIITVTTIPLYPEGLIGVVLQLAKSICVIVYHNTKCYSLVKKDTINEDYKYFLAIFNSALMWFYIKNTIFRL